MRTQIGASRAEMHQRSPDQESNFEPACARVFHPSEQNRSFFDWRRNQSALFNGRCSQTQPYPSE